MVKKAKTTKFAKKQIGKKYPEKDKLDISEKKNKSSISGGKW